jgi:hypothetical protein
MSWAGGSTREWREIRAFVLSRDGYVCRAHRDGWCARAHRATSHECTDVASHAHHTRGKRFGDDPEHIVAACPPCNLFIGDPSESADPSPTPQTRW